MPRDCINWHLTYKGHYALPMVHDYKRLAYCHEEGDGTNHTLHSHCLLVLSEPISKANLIKDLTPYLEEDCQLDVKAHKNWQTMYGYHIGLGDKPSCGDKFYWITEPMDADDYIRNKCMHKAQNPKERILANNFVLETPITELISRGLISYNNYSRVKKDIEEFKSDFHNAAKQELQSGLYLPNDWGRDMQLHFTDKQRHFFIYGPRNCYKTTFITKLERTYRTGTIASEQWWDVEYGVQLLTFDAVGPNDTNKGSILSWNNIERMSDNRYLFNRKGRSHLRPNDNYIIVICSNYHYHDLWGQENSSYFEARFQVIDLHNFVVNDT